MGEVTFGANNLGFSSSAVYYTKEKNRLLRISYEGSISSTLLALVYAYVQRACTAEAVISHDGRTFVWCNIPMYRAHQASERFDT